MFALETGQGILERGYSYIIILELQNIFIKTQRPLWGNSSANWDQTVKENWQAAMESDKLRSCNSCWFVLKNIMYKISGLAWYFNSCKLECLLQANMKSILRHWASYLNPFWEPDAIIIVSSLFQQIRATAATGIMPVESSSELTD